MYQRLYHILLSVRHFYEYYVSIDGSIVVCGMLVGQDGVVEINIKNHFRIVRLYSRFFTIKFGSTLIKFYIECKAWLIDTSVSVIAPCDPHFFVCCSENTVTELFKAVNVLFCFCFGLGVIRRFFSICWCHRKKSVFLQDWKIPGNTTHSVRFSLF